MMGEEKTGTGLKPGSCGFWVFSPWPFFSLCALWSLCEAFLRSVVLHPGDALRYWALEHRE